MSRPTYVHMWYLPGRVLFAQRHVQAIRVLHALKGPRASLAAAAEKLWTSDEVLATDRVSPCLF